MNDQSEEPIYSATWAVVGRANVGKSTLINALVGHKVSIVSAKPNTTQKHMLGVVQHASREVLLVDLPGWVSKQSRNRLGRLLQQELTSQMAGCDGILWLVAYGQWEEEEKMLAERLQFSEVPVWLVVTQIDRRIAPKSLLSWQQHVQPCTAWLKQQFLTSSHRNRGLSLLLEKLLMSGQQVDAWQVPNLDVSTHSKAEHPDAFWLAELIREQVFIQLHQELPYRIAVTMDDIQQTGNRRALFATIWTSEDQHRGMIIGHRGQQLKKIGSEARQSIQQATGVPWHLQLTVLVKPDWQDKADFLSKLGWA